MPVARTPIIARPVTSGRQWSESQLGALAVVVPDRRLLGPARGSSHSGQSSTPGVTSSKHVGHRSRYLPASRTETGALVLAGAGGGGTASCTFGR